MHFEMGYHDRERMKKFYSETFGCTMQQLGAEMGNDVVAKATDTDAITHVVEHSARKETSN